MLPACRSGRSQAEPVLHHPGGHREERDTTSECDRVHGDADPGVLAATQGDPKEGPAGILRHSATQVQRIRRW